MAVDNKSKEAMLRLYGEEKSTQENKEHEGEDDEIYCGVGDCRPGVMQKCTNIGCVTLALCFAGLSTSTLNIYINSQITTLERQFGFSSSVSGILMSCNDFGYLLTTLIMSYLARRVHIPRALGLSTILFGISGLLCTIPFFVTRNDLPPLSELTSTNSSPLSVKRSFAAPLCEVEVSQDDGGFEFGSTGNSSNWTDMGGYRCGESNRPPTRSAISEDGRELAIAFLAIGMMFQGFGKSPRQPFIGTYIDDNVPKTRTTLYLGLVSSVSIFGPVIAFTLGGLFSKTYVTLEDTDMSPMDPRWVGAWWLGFLIFGTFGILTATPLFFFPRRLRHQPELRAMERDRKRAAKGRECVHEMKEFLKTLLRLVTTPVFILTTVAGCVSLFGIGGMISFLPKYLETQFMIPAWQANIMLGVLNVLAAAGGTLLGGFVTSRFKWSPLTCLKFMVGVTILSAGFVFTGFFLGCDQPVISMGASMRAAKESNTSGTCATSCLCDDSRFFPTCGIDGVTYFSPCHAGCSESMGRGYGSCSCINATAAGIGNSSTASQVLETRPGFCKPDCNNLYPYSMMNFFGAFVATFVIMPGFIVGVRSVSEKDKPLAIGLSAFLQTLLGWFLGPIVYGKMVDSCCLLWSSGCSGNGSCSLYDLDLFRFRYHAMFFSTRVGQIVLYVIALLVAIFSRNPFVGHSDRKAMEPTIQAEVELLVREGGGKWGGAEEEEAARKHARDGRPIFIGRNKDKV